MLYYASYAFSSFLVVSAHHEHGAWPCNLQSSLYFNIKQQADLRSLSVPEASKFEENLDINT